MLSLRGADPPSPDDCHSPHFHTNICKGPEPSLYLPVFFLESHPFNIFPSLSVSYMNILALLNLFFPTLGFNSLMPAPLPAF